MKFGPKSLRFGLPVLTVFRRYLHFIGRDNTIHLQETAAVIEGDLVRFSLPVLDLLIWRAFAERSMITIPYGRIMRLAYPRYCTAKALWWLLAAAVTLLCYSSFMNPTEWDLRLYTTSVVAATTVGLGVLVHVVFHPRHVLTFRGADHKRRLVCFRFTTAKRRRQFTDVLKANRDAARALAGPSGKSRTARGTG